MQGDMAMGTGITSKPGNVLNTLFTFVFLLVISSTASIVYAKPSIVSWSSSGGHTKNKDGPQDRMYLVKGGDKVTFTVKAEGVKKYIWQVNKKVQKKAKSNSFRFTVPNEKGIWEIHVQAIGKDGVAHAEWVISTLSKEEAPTFFDYFADKKYAKRTETDPWGRKLPEWNTTAISAKWRPWQELWRFLPGGKWGKGYGPWYEKLKKLDVSGCFVQATSMAPEPNYPRQLLTFLRSKSQIEFGTWKLRFRFPNGKTVMKGGKTNLRFYYAHNNGYYLYPFWYGVACDGFQAFRVGGSKFDRDEKFPVDKNWHEVRIIRTPDNQLYCYIDGQFRFRGKTARQTWKGDTSIYIGLSRYQPDRYPRDTLYVDGVETYEGKYLFPTKPAKLLKDKSIIVTGQATTLEQICQTINKPSAFAYNPAAREAASKVSLTVAGGADLLLKNASLNVEPADKAFAVGRDGTLVIDDGSITAGKIIIDQPFGLVLNSTRLITRRSTVKIAIPAMTYGNWRINRLILTGENDKRIITEFVLHGDTTRLNVYNSDFGQSQIKVTGKGDKPGVLGLVNCKFGALKASGGAGVAPKYYLDVRVVDRRGKPVAGAKVSVRNEVDDFNFPAENCQEFQPHGGGTSEYLHESVIPRKISYTTKRYTFTGTDGHTPLPKDAKNTLVLTDFVKDNHAVKQFTYTIIVEVPRGRRVIKKVITGVNPSPDWYRADPNKPTYTITIISGSKPEVETEKDLQKKGLAKKLANAKSK